MIIIKLNGEEYGYTKMDLISIHQTQQIVLFHLIMETSLCGRQIIHKALL